MKKLLGFYLFSICIQFIFCFKRGINGNVPVSKLKLSSTLNEKTTTNLEGYSLIANFNGLGLKDMSCRINFLEKFAVSFSGGISSRENGFWRVLSIEGKDTVEATHPLPPEYLFFYDIWESNILWRGTLDVKAKKVLDGQVLTKKKKFGIIPYTDVLATFEATLYSPDDEVPVIDVPSFDKQSFVPPEDFNSPFDMKRFPEYFNKDFIDWWFQVEDALAEGRDTVIPRPRPFFTPNGDASSASSSDDRSFSPLRKRQKGTGEGPVSFKDKNI